MKFGIKYGRGTVTLGAKFKNNKTTVTDVTEKWYFTRFKIKTSSRWISHNATDYCLDQSWPVHHLTNKFSIIIQIWRKFHFTHIQNQTYWMLQNFAYATTAQQYTIQEWNYSQTKFPSNLNYASEIMSRMGHCSSHSEPIVAVQYSCQNISFASWGRLATSSRKHQGQPKWIPKRLGWKFISIFIKHGGVHK